MVLAISVEVFPGVLQTEQKHIGKWREAIEAEMNIRHNEIYRKDPGEATQATDYFVWEHCDEGESRNGTDCRLPWRNRGESSDCTRILQHVWFLKVTIESRTKA